MKKSGFDKVDWLKKAIRRVSYKFPPRYRVKVEARVSRGQYRCNICKGVFPNSEIQLDHVEPVVNPETGFMDWNDYILRMFPDASGFQVVCRDCHNNKSAAENSVRRENAASKSKKET
jgi:hypothetical protein